MPDEAIANEADDAGAEDTAEVPIPPSAGFASGCRTQAPICSRSEAPHSAMSSPWKICDGMMCSQGSAMPDYPCALSVIPLWTSQVLLPACKTHPYEGDSWGRGWLLFDYQNLSTLVLSRIVRTVSRGGHHA